MDGFRFDLEFPSLTAHTTQEINKKELEKGKNENPKQEQEKNHNLMGDTLISLEFFLH